jgi:release factor glutamine methyltransferase
MPDTDLTIKNALDKSAEYLKKKDSNSPRLDAEILLAHVMKKKRLQLYLEFDRPLSDNEKNLYRECLKKRAEHEPVAYITGEKEFMSLSFKVTPDVLIPRPDTEMIVEESIRKIKEWKKQNPEKKPSILEIGTGSGAISISILHHFADLEITATDISESAIHIAEENAMRHNFANRIRFVHGDLFAGAKGPFDFIISNPPYIASGDINTLSPDIIRHEPHQALFSGKEGLDTIKRILSEGEKKLSPGGWILVEIGEGQYEKIKKIIDDRKKIQIVEDFAGIIRVLCMQ